MRRYRYLGPPDQPGMHHNVIYGPEPPRRIFISILTFLAVVDAFGKPFPCRKPWQTLHSFFYQFGDPYGGLIFDANSGLCSTGQMALEFGNWDVIAFEKDRTIWQKACDIIRDHVDRCNKKDEAFLNKISSSFDLQGVLDKLKSEGVASLTTKEVSSVFTLEI